MDNSLGVQIVRTINLIRAVKDFLRTLAIKPPGTYAGKLLITVLRDRTTICDGFQEFPIEGLIILRR